MKKRQNLIRTIAGLMTVMLMLDQAPVMKAFAVSDTDVTEAVSDETEIDEDSEIALDDENDDPESGDSEGELDDNSEDENESDDEECVNDNDEKNPDEDNTEEEILNENDTISENDAEEDEGSEEVTVSDNTAEDEILLEEDSEQETYDSEGDYNAAFAIDYAENHWDDGVGLCAEFVSNCLTAGGINVPSSVKYRATLLRGWLNETDLGYETECSYSGGYFYQSDCPVDLQPGDVVFYYCDNCSGGPYSIHVVMFNGWENGKMKAFSHNKANSGQSPYPYNSRCYDCGGKLDTVHVFHFFDSDCGHQPVGNVDIIQGGNGNIFVRGWAYDPDDTSAQLSISVYIGGPAGSGAEGYLITANTERTDVDEAMGCGAYHGFHQTINVGARGSQKVYIYASDVGEHWIGNPELPGSGQTVTINNKAAYAINFPYASVELKTGETKTIDFTFQGDGIYSFNATIDDWDIANAAITSPDWTKNPVPTSIVLTGKSAGTTSWTYYLLDSSRNVLYQKTMVVKVVQSVTGITLNKSSMSLNVGGTDTLTATVRPSNANNKNVTWSSNNTNVATVSSSGVVTAKGAGTATITVKTADGSYTATCNVTVVRPQTAFAINFPYDILELVPGEKKTIDFTFQGDGIHSCNAGIDNGDVMTGVCNSIDWTKNPVPVSMTMTAKTAGTTSWSFDLLDDDGNVLYSKTMQVKVSQPVTGVTLNKNTMSLSAGYNDLLTANILPADASNKEVTWSSSNTNVVTVLDGVVSAKTPGTATVTVKTVEGGYTANCTVTVTQRAMGVMLDKTSLQLTTGESMGLTATVVPSNASNKNVIWSSSDNTIATVSTTGVITAQNVGTAIITVKTNDGSYTQTCTVTVTQAVTGIFISESGTDKDELKRAYVVSGKAIGLRANLRPVGDPKMDVTWQSSDESIATIVPISAVCAIVYAHDTGNVRIRASVDTGDTIYSYGFMLSVLPEGTENEHEITVISGSEDVEKDGIVTIRFEYTGNVNKIEAKAYDDCVFCVSEINYYDSENNRGKCNLKIRGVGSGTSTLNIILIDSNGQIVATQDCSIKVINPISHQYLGDISGDDKINAADRIYLARSLAGWSGYPVRNELTADVNKDEKVNAADRIYLARYLAGWNGYDIE